MALFRAPRVALVACATFLVAACDDPVGTTDPPPADAALLVGATGALRAVPADARGTPREIGRVGDRVYRCAARIDGLGVLLTVADSTTANRRFVVVDPRTGERRREIALAPIERATPDSARLDVAFPFFCTVDARGTRIAVPGRAAGRNGVAILALDDPRLVAFLPVATFPALGLCV